MVKDYLTISSYFIYNYADTILKEVRINTPLQKSPIDILIDSIHHTQYHKPIYRAFIHHFYY